MIHLHTATPKLEEGQYYVEVKLSWLSFGIPCDSTSTLWFQYDRSAGALNIQPPQLPDSLPTVFDAIWDLRHRETCYAANPAGHEEFTDLKAEHWMRLEDIPEGLSLKDICKKQKNKAWVPKRLGYMKPAPRLTLACQRWLHPRLHRPLTLRELSRICGATIHPNKVLTVPELVTSLPETIRSWAGYQVQSGEVCWESTFNKQKNRWDGKRFEETPQVKTFDLRQLVPNYRSATLYPDEIITGKYEPAHTTHGGYIWSD